MLIWTDLHDCTKVTTSRTGKWGQHQCKSGTAWLKSPQTIVLNSQLYSRNKHVYSLAWVSRADFLLHDIDMRLNFHIADSVDKVLYIQGQLLSLSLKVSAPHMVSWADWDAAKMALEEPPISFKFTYSAQPIFCTDFSNLLKFSIISWCTFVLLVKMCQLCNLWLYNNTNTDTMPHYNVR